MQAIPELAKVVKELYVFQRTPSTIDVRDQRVTTPGRDRCLVERTELGQETARELARISSGRTAMKANDDYLSGKVADFRERRTL